MHAPWPSAGAGRVGEIPPVAHDRGRRASVQGVLMLVDTRDWDSRPPDPDEEPAPRRPLPRPPWRPFAWIAAFLWLLFAAGTVGGLAGYLLILVAVGVGCWRVERWCARQY